MIVLMKYTEKVSKNVKMKAAFIIIKIVAQWWYKDNDSNDNNYGNNDYQSFIKSSKSYRNIC